LVVHVAAFGGGRGMGRQLKTKDQDSNDDLSLGLKMRQIRKARGLSLQSVARKAGVSIGLVSQIERGLTSPSIRSLRQLGAALEVPVERFFGDGEETETNNSGIVVHPRNRRILNLSGKGIIKELLTPGASTVLELMIVSVEPSGSSGTDFYNHEGEEAGLVLSGKIELWVGNRNFIIEEGDSFRFPSVTPHRFANPGEIPAKVLWAVTPPIY
jgi:mannose-6-phosphate isomerase-like protein (cupin superfamily)